MYALYAIAGAAVAGAGLLAPVTARAETLVADGFESGSLEVDVNEVDDVLEVNDSFSWIPPQTGLGDSVQVTSNNPHSGNYSLELTAAGGSDSDDAWIEAPFIFTPPQDEIWIRWYQYYPDGSEGLGTAQYFHRDTSSVDNNKLLLVGNPAELDWDGFSIFGMETVPGARYGIPAIGCSYVLPKWRPDGRNAGRHGLFWINNGQVQNASLRGRWVEYVAHFRVASGFGVEDGVMQFWVDGHKIIDETRLNSWPEDISSDESSLNVLTGGYIMGWMNSGFSATTKTWIDDFEIATTSLAPEPTPSQPTDLTAE